MDRVRQIEKILLRSRRLPTLVIVLVLLVLAAVVTLSTLQVRDGIRGQIAGRDSEVLNAVALMHYAEDEKEGLSLANDADQMSIVLKSAQLRGVLGVRLFSREGDFVASFPLEVIEAELPDEHLPALRKLQPISRFHPRMELFRLFYLDDSTKATATVPILEVIVPLHREGGSLDGIAQFLIEGQSIAAEYSRLDRRLAMQGLVAFLAGGVLLAGTLLWAFRRLQGVQGMLAERTENLARANQELALAAKTSALGAVTAHLLHGLKNPLAGLQSFVTSQGAVTPMDGDSAWQQAIASTRRMQMMVNQVVSVLREVQGGTEYEVTLAELEGIVCNRVQPLAREVGVGFKSIVESEGALANRVANLTALILINLAENAIQVTPRGKTVTLIIKRKGGQLYCEVRDEGGGFPAHIPLFTPCRSTKEGGTGIGLALCKQLALHLGAELELATSTPGGCVFSLRVPLTASVTKPEMATERA
jgi:signal transduction histidine kinase